MDESLKRGGSGRTSFAPEAGRAVEPGDALDSLWSLRAGEDEGERGGVAGGGIFLAIEEEGGGAVGGEGEAAGGAGGGGEPGEDDRGDVDGVELAGLGDGEGGDDAGYVGLSVRGDKGFLPRGEAGIEDDGAGGDDTIGMELEGGVEELRSAERRGERGEVKAQQRAGSWVDLELGEGAEIGGGLGGANGGVGGDGEVDG